MPGGTVEFSPRGGGTSVFVGRDDYLALARRRWDAAAEGSGHFLLVAGEAGIGKTRLIREFARTVSDGRQIATSVFPRDIDTVGGVLVDLAAELSRTGDSRTGAAIRDRVLGTLPDAGDSSRQRRLLVSDLSELVLSVVSESPVLLLLEDLHWADELSLDVLERVGVGITRTPSMIIASYRSDELYPHTPLRRLRARLLEQRLAEEIRLPRLSLDETLRLIALIGGELRSTETVESIVDRSGGIPLYVEELLADTSAAVPATIADAIAIQVATLAPSTVPVLQAAAVIGRSFDVDLLAAVAGHDSTVVDAALSELAERNLLLRGDDGSTLDFRHALIRDVVYESVAPLRKRDLHAAVARAAVAAGFRNAFISDQFEHAREPAAAYAYSIVAARDAVRISAHREAVELFRRAERTAPTSIDDAERAALHSDLAAVLEATDDNTSAATHYATAIEVLRRSGAEVDAARLVPRLAAVNHLLGFDFERRTALIDDELRRLDALDLAAPEDVRAALLASSAAAHMLDRRLEDALRVGADASAAAVSDTAAPGVGIDIDMTVGAVLTFAGRPDEGWPLLESTIARARDAHFEATSARGFRMIGSCASVLVEYSRASEWIAAGLTYTTAAERWNDHHYLAAHAGHVGWATGNWTTGQHSAAVALADGGSGITTRSCSLTVLGFLAFGRSEFADARVRLDEARTIGEQMHELQRLLPALWGLAETDLLESNPESARDLCELAFSRSKPIGDAAYIFPFLITGTRAYLALRDGQGARDWFERCALLLRRRDIPGTRPALAHAEGLLNLAAGQTGIARVLLEDARAGWVERERFWEGTRALIDLAQCANRSRRPRDAASLLAMATAAATAAGATALESLVHDVDVDDARPGPLSARELDVARLVAAGSTNREIAERLVISPKTASSHIEHILAKLGASRRAEIAAWVTRAQN